jgi:dienelactone hydrolase
VLISEQTNPQQRVEDLHDAITFLQGNHVVDPEKIAIWGLCFDGNIALALAAAE